MALDMGITELVSSEDFTKNNIYAGVKETYGIDITVVGGAGKLVRGQELGKITASGKFTKYIPNAHDGSETLVAILGVDVDASSTDQKAFAYIHGEFNASALTGDYTAYTGAYNMLNIKKEVL